MSAKTESISIAESVFVTVGTTSFDALVKAVTEERFTKLIEALGYSGITVQLGKGEYVPSDGSKVKWYRYKTSLREDMLAAGLIISHGGAGCIMESLSLNKPLVVAVNDTLMNNHQTELARRLSGDGHLIYTTPSGLYEVIQGVKGHHFSRFQSSQPQQFGKWLDSVLGYC